MARPADSTATMRPLGVNFVVGVPLRAMSNSSVACCVRLTSQEVDSARHWLAVIWSYTASIPTEMISIQPGRDWSDEQLMDQSMHQVSLALSTTKADVCIAIAGKSASVDPAWPKVRSMLRYRSILVDFGPQSDKVFRAQDWHRAFSSRCSAVSSADSAPADTSPYSPSRSSTPRAAVATSSNAVTFSRSSRNCSCQ